MESFYGVLIGIILSVLVAGIWYSTIIAIDKQKVRSFQKLPWVIETRQSQNEVQDKANAERDKAIRVVRSDITEIRSRLTIIENTMIPTVDDMGEVIKRLDKHGQVLRTIQEAERNNQPLT